MSETAIAIALEEVVKRQQKIIDALMERIERGDEIRGSQFSIFQSAIALQQEVEAKSKRLEDALLALGSTSDKLQNAYSQHENTQQNLLDVLEVMQEGFALFTGGELAFCNDQFRNLFRDVQDRIEPGIGFQDYMQAILGSEHLVRDGAKSDLTEWKDLERKLQLQPYFSTVFPLRNDRWVQFAFRHTSFGNIAILQTDISNIARQTRLEKDHLIDKQARYLQGTFDHLAVGVASFSPEWRLQIHNKMFADLLKLPANLLTKGVFVDRILDYVLPNATMKFADAKFNPYHVIKHPENFDAPIVFELHTKVTLEFKIYQHPEGGYMVNLRDITLEERAKESLRLINEDLEARVEARTEELNIANVELLAAKENAEQANLSKTRFLAAASHDLLQPVNAAKLYISMLKDQESELSAPEYIARLDRAFNNMEALLHDLLDISHLESQTMKFNVSNIELSSFLEHLAEDFQQLAHAKSITVRARAPHVYVKSDTHYLHRIIGNLLSNAVNYTPENGRVMLSARLRGDAVCIEVRDNGIGMSEADLERIFEEFTRLDPVRSPSFGVGLGLSIVKRACHQLGHKLEVKSERGQGSVFRVYVPISREIPVLQTTIKARQSTEKLTFDCLIFLIDNDPEVLFATASLLESWGANVIAVPSIEKAVQQYNELGEKPHLVIADYQLDNDETGIEAIKVLRKISAEALPAIMISANPSEALEKSGELFDFTVLEKPIRVQNLRRLIAQKIENPEFLKKPTQTPNLSRG